MRPLIMAACLCLAACSGHSGGSDRAGSGGTPPTIGPTHPATTPSHAGGSSRAGSLQPAPGATPRGGPVPPGFSAGSVTFVSPTEGWVLGTAPCSTPPCTSILRTTDAGRTWVGIPAPRVAGSGLGESDGHGSVHELRFADPTDGFAYGTGLWETHDGGSTWARARTLAGMRHYEVAALEPDSGHIYAVVSRAASDGEADGPPVLAIGTPSGAFRALRALPGDEINGLSTAGDDGVIVDQTTLYTVTPDGSIHHNRLPASPCSVAGSSTENLVAICGEGVGGGSMGDRKAFGSDDGGRHWNRLPNPGRGSGYDGTAVTVTTAGHAAIATSSAGGSGVLDTTDYAKTWHLALTFRDEAAGFADLGFENAADAVVIHAPWATRTHDAVRDHAPTRGRLYRSVDGGATWNAISF
jgi:photosystem II stability/assembly factor-like uncharacterized protein